MNPIFSTSIIFLLIINIVTSFGIPGKFEFELSKERPLERIINRAFYNRTQIVVKVTCVKKGSFKIGWVLRLSECMDEFYINTEILPDNMFYNIYETPKITYNTNVKKIKYQKQHETEIKCEFPDSLVELQFNHEPLILPDEEGKNVSQVQVHHADHDHLYDTIAHTWQDGPYSFIIMTRPSQTDSEYAVKVSVGFQYKNGFLSANDWPFLPFYATMCAVYSLFAVFWLVMCLIYWRDLLRVQIWISGVILLGLMEKAAFLAEYEQIERTGEPTNICLIIAEVVSCSKRTLARMLVIIVSLGFGIVKPRLGPTMQKVLIAGGLYFIFAILEGLFRIKNRKEDIDNKGAFAGVPLVFIDVGICYWILTNLKATMRTLRVRRNIPKLTLFRHFTNTLIFCVIASVIFMIWSLARHRFVACLTDWKELWLDEGFWHILFSFILLVIVVLWRPSNNAQRFAFTPLLDNDENFDDDDENEEQENEIFDSVKMRTTVMINGEHQTKKEKRDAKQANSIEEDLKWVEENVPATLTEAALPGMVDSEEEVQTTKFEASKMD